MTDVIRQLRPGERVPDSQPRRYISDHGYMRLRWHVGIARYVETYEHRVFDGVVTTAEHVHHINGRKTDNRVENRQCMTADEHNAHHADHRKPRAWAPFRSYTAMRKAAEAENRRFDIARRTERMREPCPPPASLPVRSAPSWASTVRRCRVT